MTRAHAGQKGARAPDKADLIAAIAALFEAGKAANLVKRHGYDRCLRQLTYLGRRCEQLAQTERGLVNRIGVYIASVKKD